MSVHACVTRLVAVTMLFASAPIASAATVYNAGADLTANMAGVPINSYGVWTYGSATNTLGAGFAQLPFSGAPPAVTSAFIRGWYGTGTVNLPWILVNTDTSPQSACCGITPQQPNEILMHGSSATSLADLRFTAPDPGWYSINAFMERLHTNEGNVNIVVNGVSVHNVNLDGSPQTSSFMNTYLLNVGDTIDVTAGLGDGGNLNSNAIGLNLLITASLVPEPSTFALLGLGTIGLAIRKRRRRAK